MCVQKVAPTLALAENPSMTESVPQNKKRDKLLANLDILPFDKLIRRYAALPMTLRLRGMVKQIIKNLGLMPIIKKILKRGK